MTSGLPLERTESPVEGLAGLPCPVPSEGMGGVVRAWGGLEPPCASEPAVREGLELCQRYLLDTSMRTLIYISAPQHLALKEAARRQKVSVSALVRRAVDAAYAIADTTRGYEADGEHTKQKREAAEVERILARVGKR